MEKKAVWLGTDIPKIKREYSRDDLYTEFKRLLLFYMDKRATIFRRYKVRHAHPRFISNTHLFRDYYIDGLNILKKHGKKRKRISPKNFLTNKFDRNDLIKGIMQLQDYEPFIKILEDEGNAGDITKIINTTLRAEALLFYGVEKFFKEMNAKVIDQRGEQKLLSLSWHKSEEPITMVKVIDSTTKNVYLLRVPPNTKTVREAVAWSFNLEIGEYRPIKET